MKPLKIAIVGASRISAQHIEAINRMPDDFNIIAICDLDKSRIDEVLKQSTLGKIKCDKISKYTDVIEMLKKEKINCVTVATDSSSHADITLKVIRHKLHVLVEKPIALSLHDADIMIEEAKNADVKLAVCHQLRFNKSVAKLKDTIDSGDFGKLYHGSVNIRMNRNEEYFKQAPWRGTWAKDGGSLLNQCVHDIDILRWIMGDDIEEVCAYSANTGHPYVETDDTNIAIIRFANGTLGSIETTINAYPRNLEESMLIFGQKGTIKLLGKGLKGIDIWNVEGHDTGDIKSRYSTDMQLPGEAHEQVYLDFADAIRNDRAPKTDGSVGRRALELVLAMYLSNKEKRAVKLPLKNAATSDFEGMFK